MSTARDRLLQAVASTTDVPLRVLQRFWWSLPARERAVWRRRFARVVAPRVKGDAFAKLLVRYRTYTYEPKHLQRRVIGEAALCAYSRASKQVARNAHLTIVGVA